MAARPKKPAASTPKPPVQLNGSLDRADADGTIEGWCWSPEEPGTHRLLAVLLDGAEAAQVECDQERDDLVRAGVGDGQHAFLLCLEPEAMQAGATVEVALRDIATGQAVGTPRKVTWPAAPAAAAAPVADVPVLHGHLDRVSRDGWVSGWCWYPGKPGTHVDLTVLVDNQTVGQIVAANFRPDLQQAGIGDGTHGFSFALPYSALADKGTLVVAVQETGTGRNLSEPVTVRLGRMAAIEERVQDMERQLRLLRGQIDDFGRAARAQDEDRATRALFGTVAAFFSELAQGGGGAMQGLGLAGALDSIAATCPPLTLADPATPEATICIAATAGVEAIYACLAALHDAGAGRRAEIVLLDAGEHGGEAALLPSVVRNLRYVRLHAPDTLMQGRTAVARSARAPIVAFLSPQARPAAGWLDEILATFAAEPDAAAIGGRLARPDGLLEAFGLLADDAGRLHDPGHLALADAGMFRFLRRVDALSGHAAVLRRDALLAAGGFSDLYHQFGHAMADLCMRLAEAGHSTVVQPLATAIWIDHGVPNPDAAAPDLALGDEQTLRLRERLRAQGWPPALGAGGFIGHALVIDDDLPRPDRDAGSIATWEQMQVLRRLGYRVTLCPVHAGGLVAAELDGLRRCGIEVATPPDYGSVTEYLQAEGARLDLVHVYRHANMAMLLDRIRELAPAAKLVFATADLHFLREQRRAELAGAPMPDAARDDELRCIRAADAAIVTSDYELDLLAREPDPGKLVLLRWIVRPEPVARGFAARRDICFVGNFRHPPNLDGVLWFVAEVLPLLRQALPGVRLRLAGSDMPAQVRELASAFIEVMGWVEDLAGLFAEVRLSVAPLRFGAGFKGKVATSLAHGLPVVGSSISLEGTGLQDGDGVLVADEPQAFADAIVRLHEDRTLWEAQSARALDRVAALYSPQAAEAVWRTMLTDLDLPARA